MPLGIATTCPELDHEPAQTRSPPADRPHDASRKGFVSLPVDLIVAMELQFIGTIGMQPRR
ncbi:MAG: hypothetical protein IPH23_11375 [Gammaproteobacteria bacterium]|nr:hypothetical protein [Gammaproteobacteria bacterium]